jgi:hypothetical protein
MRAYTQVLDTGFIMIAIISGFAMKKLESLLINLLETELLLFSPLLFQAPSISEMDMK